jgi:hypothetical protein
MTRNQHFADDGQHSYGDGSQDVPLFALSKRQAQVRGVGERIKRPPTAAWAVCPQHASPDKVRGTGMAHTGEHLVWIAHYVKVGRSSVPCRASGVAICHPDAGPVGATMRVWVSATMRDVDNGQRPAACPHAGPRVHGRLSIDDSIGELAPELRRLAAWHCTTCGFAAVGRAGLHPTIRDGATHLITLGWAPAHFTPKD